LSANGTIPDLLLLPSCLQGPPGFPGKAGPSGPPGPQAEKASDSSIMPEHALMHFSLTLEINPYKSSDI